MNILLTGHKGFIGSNLLRHLSNHNVTTYEWGDRLPTVKGHDWVIHVGAISSTAEKDVEKVLTQNLDFSVWLLDQCITHDVHLQYSSSASVYGQGQYGFAEDAPVEPRTPYAWSKYLFERLARRIAPTNIHVQGFRYFNVYGPGEDHKGDMASPYHKFTHQFQSTGRIQLFENSSKYVRDFVPVSHVCEIHTRFLSIPQSGVWNVGSGAPKSFEEVALSIGPANCIEYIKMPEHLRTGYQEFTCADLTKINETLRLYPEDK